MLFLKWFTSRTVRHAWQGANHIEKILRHQSDLLSKEAIAAVQADVDNVRAQCRAGDKAAVEKSLAALEKSANKWLKAYPNAALRENVEVALVAIAVAMGIRTFFLQPFKIPTGSMQPTLYGVTSEDLRGRDDVKLPNGLARFFDYWFNGVSYIHLVAQRDGTISYDAPSKLVLFNRSQNWRIDGQPQPAIWFPPDQLFERSGVYSGMTVKAGQDVVKTRVIAGDHLFVDRVTFNFRRPHRGDIVVFETHGIEGIKELNPGMPEMWDTYYIKRLCGLPGEKLRLKRDYEVTDVQLPSRDPRIPVPVGHLIVNETNEITASTPHFENLYSFPDARSTREKSFVFRENHYVGHSLERAFSPGSKPVEVAPEHYFVMGDNTLNSSDSRYWGDFNRNKVIGKSFFVYWPIGSTTYKGEQRESRFGWAHR